MAETETKRAAAGAPTWRDFIPDYLPPPRLITRAELLAEFAAEGAPINERTLRHWETVGALPRAVRQQHQGSVQAVYPHWFTGLVATVGVRREQGESLAAIAADMPARVAWNAAFFWVVESGHFPLEGYMPPEGGALVPALEALVQRVSDEVRPVATTVIILIDQHNKPISQLHWPISPGGLSNGLGDVPPDDKALSVAPGLPPPIDNE